MKQDSEFRGALMKPFLWIGAWFGSVTLADIQAVVGIVSGLIVAGLAATNWYFLLRDRLRRGR